MYFWTNFADGLIIGSGSMWLLGLTKGKFAMSKSGLELGILLAIIMSLVNSKKDKKFVFLAGILGYPFIPKSVRRIVAVFAVSRGLAVTFPNVFQGHQFHVSLLSNFIALGAFLNRPDLLSKSYLGFLERFTKQHGSDFNAFRASSMNKYSDCHCMHPATNSCVRALPAMFWDMFAHQSIPLYSRLYAPLIAISVVSRPAAFLSTALGGIKRTLRSAVTLSAYTSTVLGACCLGVKLPGGHKSIILPVLATTAGSAAFLIEPSYRQYQLSQFMMGHSLDVLVRFYESLALPVPPRIGQIMFAIGLYAMVTNLHNSTTSPSNGGFLKYILDNPDGKHSLQPSRLLMSIVA